MSRIYNSKLSNRLLVILLSIMFFSTGKTLAQLSICSSGTPYHYVNLTGQPSGTWISPTHGRAGSCCGDGNCTSYEVMLDANAMAVKFDIVSGATPSGSMYYQVNCGAQITVGDVFCVTGPGPHKVTFCKPGGNDNKYSITSIPAPSVTPLVTTRKGCNTVLTTSGFAGSITWNSISPGSTGQYNSNLSCTTCASPTFTPVSTTPQTIKYVVKGISSYDCGSVLYYTDTVTVKTHESLVSSVSPNPASFCSSASGVLLTSSVTGGDGNYTYTWKNSAGTTLGTSSTYTATSAGSYIFTIKDGLYSATCGSASVTVPVSIVTQPTVNAGPDQTKCANSPAATLNGTVSNATGGIWSGGNGTFSPSNTNLSATYTPTAAEIAAGSVTLTLTSTGPGAGCSNNSDQVKITYPAVLSLTMNSGTINCNGGSSSLSAIVAGGKPPYSYSWNIGATISSIITGSGNYCVTVTDNMGCVANACYSLTQPPSLSMTVSKTDVSVMGGTDGSITATPSGGTSPYSYSWSNGQTTQTIQNLSSGNYSVTITDAKGCSIGSGTITISNPSCTGITVNVTKTNITCYDLTNGTAAAVGSGGVGPYTYSWNDASNQTSATATGLSNGTYNVTVTDSRLCVANGNVTISRPTQLTAVTSSTDATMVGGSDGTASVTPSGATSPYTYSWNTGSANSSVVGLSKGTYTVVVKDNNNCSVTKSVVINEPSCVTFNATFNKTNVSCKNGSNGSATVIPAGGISPYSYSWSNGQSLQTATNLTDGTYLVVITDAVNCSISKNVTITEPSTLNVSTSKTNVSTVGGSDGSITATPSGGTTPYAYSWSNGQATATASDLSKGSYNVVIKDANNCTVTSGIISIDEPSCTSFSASTNTTNVSCNGSVDGSATVTPHGGVSPYTYLWSTGETTATNSTIGNGNYSVVIRDAVNCSITKSVTITEPTVLSVTTSKTDASTVGGSNGSITANPSGGTSPYDYDWSNGATTKTNSNLSAGTYSVTVTDAKGCSVESGAVLINNPSCTAFTASTSATNVSCNNGTNGSATATPSGGVSPYTYVWSNGASTQTANNLSDGNYSVVIHDAVNCSITKNVTITEPTVLSVTTSKTDASTVGGSDGSITANPAGGTSPYTYAWSNGATTKTISNLTAGSYSVTVTDSKGCNVASGAVLVNNPSCTAFSATTSTTNVSCNNGTNGSATATPAGGISPYTYVWSNAATTQTAGSLAAGNYSVVIHDAVNCSITKNVTITDPTVLSITTSKTDASTVGGSDGSITANPAGGTSPYSYAWSNGATTKTISNLSAGSYSVTVTDAKGCSVVSGAVLINNPSCTAFVAATSTTNVSCNNGTNGSSTATPSGGVSPYVYAWNNGATTQTAGSLSAGNYSVVIHDAVNCSITKNVTVSEPSVLSVTTSKMDASTVGGSNGSITANPAGGSSSYSYAWSNGGTSQTISNLSAGSYSVTVTDSKGCTVGSGNTLINDPSCSGFTASITKTNVSCNNGSNGSATAVVSGGVSPYSYTWSNSATTQTISNLSAGSYSVVVKDAVNCSASSNSTITEPSVLSVTTSKTDASTVGGSNGSITANPAGGTSPYTYAWSNGATTQTILNLSAGGYSVTVTDSKGCTVGSGAVLINNPSCTAFSATTSTTNVSCNNGTNGSATATPAGGVSPYTYAWSNGATTQTANNLSDGNYSVVIHDAVNCSVTKNVTITEPSVLSVTTSKTDPSTVGGSNGSITANPSGGTSPYSYAWSNGATTQTISNISAGTYSVTVTDAKGCTVASGNVIVSNPSCTAFAATTSTTIVSCKNGTDGSATATPSGGVSPYTYAWNNGATTQTAGSLAADNYSVVIHDAVNCSITKNVTVSEPAILSVTTSKSDASTVGGSDGSITANPAGGTFPYTYAWSNGATTQTISNLSAGSYSVTVTDSKGCTVGSGAVLINNPSCTAFTASTSTTNVSCNNGSNGSATAAPSGGVTPYTYAWSNAATTQTAGSLSAGNYSVVIHDAVNCSVTKNVTITEPSVLSVATTKTDASTVGGSNGSITANPSGGTSPYSYAWSNGATTQTISNITAGTYSVTITDAKGCTVASGNVIVNNPSCTTFTAATSTTNVSCNNGTNGTATATPAGGVSPYAYSWSTGVTTQTANNLADGNYSVVIHDAVNCSVTKNVTITEPAVLSVSTSKTDALTVGGSDGSITANPAGGTSPYTYSWSNGATTQTISNLSAGSYSVTVTDSKGCTVSSGAVLINNPSCTSFTASTSATNVSCNNGTNGSATAMPSGGVTPYTFVWSNAATTQAAGSLSAGNYSVVIHDAVNCSVTKNVTITEPPVLSVTTSKTDASAVGGSNGSVTANPSGGTSPYTYAWSNGATSQTISNLTAGSYSVIVTDSKGCTIGSGNTLVNDPSCGGFNASINGINVSCNNGTNGVANVVVSGGVSPYTFVWNNSATTQSINNLAAGSYSVIVKDAVNCSASANATITEPSVLSVTTSKTDATIVGGSDGSITANPAGGTSTYTYVWNNGATTQTISNIGAGSYSVTVTDSKGCTVASENILVNNPSCTAFTATTSTTNVNCNNGTNGSAMVTPADGISPYTYAWSSGATTQTAGNLAAGNYSVEIKDAVNCSITKNVSITEPSVLSVTTSKTDASTVGGSDGRVTANPAGGTSPYTYSWSNGATTQTISGLFSGSYSVTVTDANGCTVTSGNTLVNDPGCSGFTVSINTTNVGCNNATDGAAGVVVSGGVSPYTFAWNNSAATQSIGNLAAGSYSVVVKDAVNCSASANVTITEPSVLSVTTSKTDATTVGGSDGSITANPAGGTSPYSYSWSNGATTQTISNIAAGSYSVTITDSKGCSVASGNTLISDPSCAGFTASVNGTNVSCNNGTDGAATVVVSGGVSTYTFAWNNSATTQSLSNIGAGVYSVVVKDAVNCSASANVTISEPSDLSVTTNKTDASAVGGNDGSITANPAGGTSPYSYSWSNGATTQTISNIAAGSYSVTITDSKGCSVASGNTVINDPSCSGFIASINGTNVGCNNGTNGTATVVVNGGVSPYTFAWNNSATMQSISNLAAGSYSVFVKDAVNCSASANVVISEPTELSVTTSKTDASTVGGHDGSITANPAGGTSPYTYGWSTGATTQTISNLNSGSYSVTISDANGCKSESGNVLINNPGCAGFTASINGTNVSCNNGTSGAATVVINGGVSPYTFAWDNSATTQSISNLIAGSYSVVVKDAVNCSASANAVISEPSVLSVTTSKTDASTVGGNDGSITANPVGGETPYNYLWSTGAIAQTILNLTKGSYSVTVTDANGCTVASGNTLVNDPNCADFSASIIGSNVSCNNATNGNAIVVLTGGVAPYTFAWNNSGASQTIDNLGAGSYSVIVKDAVNCSSSANVVISEPTALSLTTSKTDASTVGGTDGSITANPIGGTTPYSYVWNNGATTRAISNVGAGSYNVDVTDAHGCSVSSGNVLVNNPDCNGFFANIDGTDTKCNSESSGTAMLNVFGGSGPYSYKWNNGSASKDLNNLPVGFYSVIIKDALNCSASANVEIAEPPMLSVSTTKTNVSTVGGTDGSITANPFGGTSMYTYLWSNGATTKTISNISSGSYSVTVTDAKGCTVGSGNNLINDPSCSGFTANISKVDVSCKNADNGSATVHVSGGAGPYIYTWNNGQSTETASVLSAGTYSVVVKDNLNCSTSANVVITEPSMLAVSLNVTPTSKVGGNDGAVAATPSGGTTPYRYDWSNGASTQNIANLVAGPYYVSVIDSNDCMVTSSTEIINDPACGGFAANAVSKDVNCNASNNGEVGAKVVGGKVPYTYTWSNGATTASLTNLAPGNYSVEIKDSVNCSASLNVTIAEPDAVSLNVTKVDASGVGKSDGSMTANITGGTIPYTYLWNNGATTKTISNLIAGTYSVTVKDSNGCTASSGDQFINDPVCSGFTATTTTTNATCNGENNGIATANVIGGKTPYTYSWNNGATTTSLTNLAPGNYSVVIKDSVNCSASVNVTIAEPAALILSTSKVDASGVGKSDGSMIANITGGTIPYTYLWNNGATTKTISNLIAGTYNVIVKDSNGCTASSGDQFINDPICSGFTATTTSTNATCNGENNGIATANVIGGKAPYTYSWNNGATTASLTNLAPGNYSVVIKDSVNCSASVNVTIAEPAALILSTSKVDASGVGKSDGSMTANVSGGITPYTYLWNNGATTKTISNLIAGTYNVTVKDSNGCTASSGDQFINDPACSGFTASASSVNATCSGANNGTVTTNVTGGKTPYTFAWSNGATTASLTNLAPGNYSVVIKDSVNCSASVNVTISEPAALSLTTSKVDASGVGKSDGSITANVSGGTIPYTYVWNNGSTTKTISNLIAGTYSVTVKDSNGCTASSGDQFINDPACSGFTASATSTDATCNGENNGIATANVIGGKAPYTYSWNNGATTASLNNLAPGNYSVVIKDSVNCSASVNVTISEPAALSLTTSKVDASGVGKSDGSMTANITGGTIPYTYLWNNGAITKTISNLIAGTYSVTVKDSNGCTASSGDQFINDPACSGFTASASSVNATCSGANNGTVTTNVIGGKTPYTFAWSNGATTTSLTNLAPGNYSVVIKDSVNCSASVNVTISEPAALSLTTSKVDASGVGKSDGSMTANITGGTIPYTYLWNNGATTKTISNLIAGTYNVIVKDSNGCSASSGDHFINDPACSGFTASATSTDATCSGANNGTVTTNVSGGKTPYVFAWSNGATTTSLANLAPGNYSVVIKDSVNCSASVNVTIAEPAAVSLNVTKIDASGVGKSDGSMIANITGGTTPYTYVWNTGSTTKTISNLIAGTYNVTVKDSNGCSVSSGDQFINDPACSGFTATTTSTNATCNGANNGTARAKVVGGKTPYVFAWSNGATTTFLANLAPGNYSVVIKDSVNCSASVNVTIAEPAAVSLNVTKIDASGVGKSDGSMIANITGGTIPYTYVWNTGSTTKTISNLIAGTYNVIVKDSNGCTASSGDHFINDPACSGFTASATSTDATCNGENNGIATANVIGGKAPYTYAWNNGATTTSLTNLAPGNYSVVIKDSVNCSASVNVTISEPAALSLTTSKVDASGVGKSDGSMTANITGGTIPYTYLWNNGATTKTISNLIAGTYNVIVKDSNGCTASSGDHFINDPACSGFTASATSTDATCNGENNGIATANVIGGKAPYTYSWNNGATTASLNNLAPGNYSVAITDSVNCSASVNVTIAEPAALILTTTKIDVSGVGKTDGSMTANVSGGTIPYTYVWNNGGTTKTVSNLIAGTYNVTVKDSNSCSVSSGDQFINDPACSGFTATTTSTNATCNGANNGTARAKVVGGKTPYTYAWSNGATTASLTNLAPGNYSVVIKDSVNCSASVNVTIAEPAALILTTTKIDVSGVGKTDGSMTANVSGGTTPYTYVWNNGGTTKTVSNLIAGTYSVTVKDSNGCSVSSGDQSINDPACSNLKANIVSKNVTCTGQNDGSATITAFGGKAPYSYSWSDGSKTSVLDKLSVGSYSVIIKDSSNCTLEKNVSISAPVQLKASTIVTNVKCYGASNGAIAISVAGGSNPYQYKWSGPAEFSSTTQNLQDLDGGEYYVAIKDAKGCVLTDTVSVIEPKEIQIALTSSQVTGCDQQTADISAKISGGTAPYSCNWDCENGSNTSVQKMKNAAPGSYVFEVKDSNGCKASSEIVMSTAEPLMVSLNSNDKITCYGDSAGSINTFVEGGVKPYSYNWTGPEGYTSTAVEIKNLKAGTYFLTVKDSNGCVVTSDKELIQPEKISVEAITVPERCGVANGRIVLSIEGGLPDYDFQWSDGSKNKNLDAVYNGTYNVIITDRNSCVVKDTFTVNEIPLMKLYADIKDVTCNGDTNGLINLRVEGGTAPYKYMWSNGVIAKDQRQSSAGLYQVEVSDGDGCLVSEAYNITQPEKLQVSLRSSVYPSGHNISTFQANDGSVEVIATGGRGNYTFNWSNGESSQNLTNLKAGIYSVEANSEACKTSAKIILTQPLVLEMPTGFSPNGNGQNDYFEVHGLEAYPENAITVFNRWGNIVYEKDNYKNDWKGETNGHDELPQGTYYVVLKIKSTDITLTGYVDLRR